MPRAKKKRRQKKPLTPEKIQLQQQRHFRRRIDSVFRSAGFTYITTRNKQVTFLGQDCEFDSMFVYENILVVVEDTIAGTSDKVRVHLNKKALHYTHFLSNKNKFIEFVENEFSEFKSARKPEYSSVEFKLVFVYCTQQHLESNHKQQHKHVIFLESRNLQYFLALVQTLGQSTRFELFKFLGLKASEIGIASGSNRTEYDGFILPESPSGFPPGFKVVTFYADPETLIILSYVLRKDGWADSEGLYQRMISRSKIRNMRQFLAQDERVFVNNIIVSLPSETKILDRQGDQQNLEDIVKMVPIKIGIPQSYNSIGIIDGQHRVFAYHEGKDSYEEQIAPKRKKHQLLVTGVIYPNQLATAKQREFEAQLFLEINNKQTRTRPDLRQAIESITNPFSIIAISRSVISKLAANGPLCGFIEESQFDRGKLKSSSIVSYGLRHIIKCEGNDTFFTLWQHEQKSMFPEAVKAATHGRKKFEKPSLSALDNYTDFCASSINNALVGFKMALPNGMWTTDIKVSRALTTTAINGLIFCLRRLLESHKTTDMDGYKLAFRKLTTDFAPGNFRYKSSHWRDLGNHLAKECFLS